MAHCTATREFSRRLVAGGALLVLGSTAFAQSPAGSVEFTSGQVTIRNAAGQVNPASRGAAVLAGDTVDTQVGRVQLRMVDGAYISLQPQTSLRVQAYSVAGPGGDERGFLSLLRGGLRTVTGLIGRTKRENYRLTTTTATLGIRGTEFAVTTDNGTRVNVSDGIVALCTNGGCVDIGAGQSGFAPDRQTRPALAFAPARLPPTPAPIAASFLVGEVRDSTGTSLVATTAIDAGPAPYVPPTTSTAIPIPDGAAAFAIAAVTGPGTFTAGLLGATVTSAPTGAITQAIDCCTPANNFTSGVSTDFGADGIIAWGRWTGGTKGVANPPAPLITMSYVAGSNSTAISSALTPSIVRGYASFASTAPMVTSGGTIVATGASNSVTGTLNVNFPNWASGGGTLTYVLNVPVSGQTFNINGSAAQLGTSGSFLGSASSITSTGTGCATACTGNIPFGDAIQGFFSGPGATRAGANYGFTSTIGQVSGAVVFH